MSKSDSPAPAPAGADSLATLIDQIERERVEAEIVAGRHALQFLACVSSDAQDQTADAFKHKTNALVNKSRFDVLESLLPGLRNVLSQMQAKA